MAWSPGGNSYDLPGRAAGGGGIDHITMPDIDQPGAYDLHSVRGLNFRDSEGNIQELDMHGFDARVLNASTGKPLLRQPK